MIRYLIIATALIISTSAEARTHHKLYSYHAKTLSAIAIKQSSPVNYYDDAISPQMAQDAPKSKGLVSYRQSKIMHRHLVLGREHQRFASPGPRPHAWCGWYMRQQVASDPGPQGNLARWWAGYGLNAGHPQIGTIVVWPHHVGKIVGNENGRWIVNSGNDGHAIRTRARSLAGAIAFRWPNSNKVAEK